MVNSEVCAVCFTGRKKPEAGSRLLDDALQNEHSTPYCNFTDHTLPVTDIVCGIGSFPSCRILTASIDHTVKVGALTPYLSLFFLNLFYSFGILHRKLSSRRSISRNP